ncbi:hypothetical protein CPC08DRAFT_759783 [Agrocybe pediades]|nr:hypothetical protein CPC08DRAFT_759783 [Agrocybe pediades]
MLPRSTMISSNQGILVSGSQFIQYNYHGQTSQGNKSLFIYLIASPSSLLISDEQRQWTYSWKPLRQTLQAFHDSGASFDKPKCHPQTHLKILEIIMRWIVGQDGDAQSRKPFLWLNGAAGCGKSAIAQSTIESCIGHGILLARSEVQKDILSAIQKDPVIFKKTLQQQFTALVIQPLMTHFSKNPSSQDRDDFNERATGRKLDQDWPGNGTIERLVKKSHQFVYAATVIRYAESTRHQPDHRLEVVLKIRPVNGDEPFAELDSLYAVILESALDTEKVLRVLSLFLLNTGMISCLVIERMLVYYEGEVETLFCDMGALVRLEVDDWKFGPAVYLRILHASLGEYLLDAARSKKFHIDMNYETIRHVTHSLQFLASFCSSPFDRPNTATPIFILASQQYNIGHCIGLSPIPLELRQSVFFFPLEEFLEPHTGTHVYPYLMDYSVAPFLRILDEIALADPIPSCISQDHPMRILRTAITKQIKQYFDTDRLATVLVMF